MDNTVIYIVLGLLIPIFLLCIYLEKRARRIMISFCCGVVSCLLAYFANNLIPHTFISHYEILIAPFIEELLKLIPILIIALLVNKGKRGSTANAYAVGIGFCLVENTFYLITQLSSVGIVWVLFRSIGTGLMHAMSATILGLGVYYARLKKKNTALMIILTFIAAYIFHALFNLLVSGNTVLRIIGVLIPLLTYVSIFFFVKKEDIKNFLRG